MAADLMASQNAPAMCGVGTALRDLDYDDVVVPIVRPWPTLPAVINDDDPSPLISVVETWEELEPPPMRWVIPGYIPEGYESSVVADPGLGKSYLTIYAGCCIATAFPFFDVAVDLPGDVIFIDFELNKAEFLRRLYKVAKGMGMSKPPRGLHYVEARLPLSNDGMLKACEAVVRDVRPVLTVIDSVGLAMGGLDPNKPTDTISFLQRLRPFGTQLHVDHLPKPPYGVKTKTTFAFGSIYKHALARSALHLDKGADGGLCLTHVKSNFGPLQQSPIHFRMEHRPDAVSFERVDGGPLNLAADAERIRAELDAAQRARDAVLTAVGDQCLTHREIVAAAGLEAEAGLHMKRTAIYDLFAEMVAEGALVKVGTNKATRYRRGQP